MVPVTASGIWGEAWFTAAQNITLYPWICVNIPGGIGPGLDLMDRSCLMSKRHPGKLPCQLSGFLQELPAGAPQIPVADARAGIVLRRSLLGELPQMLGSPARHAVGAGAATIVST